MNILDTGFTPEEAKELTDLHTRLTSLREDLEAFAITTGSDLIFEGIEDLDQCIMYVEMAAGIDEDGIDDDASVVNIRGLLNCTDDDDSELPF